MSVKFKKNANYTTYLCLSLDRGEAFSTKGFFAAAAAAAASN